MAERTFVDPSFERVCVCFETPTAGAPWAVWSVRRHLVGYVQEMFLTKGYILRAIVSLKAVGRMSQT